LDPETATMLWRWNLDEKRNAYLVMMGSTNEYDWSIARDVECTSRANFSEEYLCDSSPEQQSSIVSELRVILGGSHVEKEANLTPEA
jgi:hypothetical protein